MLIRQFQSKIEQDLSIDIRSSTSARVNVVSFTDCAMKCSLYPGCCSASFDGSHLIVFFSKTVKPNETITNTFVKTTK